MYTDGFIEKKSQLQLSNVLLGIALLSLAILALYIAWRWCSQNDAIKARTHDRMFMTPVYAHEIEPGIVVLQSEDGEYLKIMKEYELGSKNHYGSVSCTRPEALQPSPTDPCLERTVMNSAAYTPAAFNVPTAPELLK